MTFGQFSYTYKHYETFDIPIWDIHMYLLHSCVSLGSDWLWLVLGTIRKMHLQTFFELLGSLVVETKFRWLWQTFTLRRLTYYLPSFAFLRAGFKFERQSSTFANIYHHTFLNVRSRTTGQEHVACGLVTLRTPMELKLMESACFCSCSLLQPVPHSWKSASNAAQISTRVFRSKFAAAGKVTYYLQQQQKQPLPRLLRLPALEAAWESMGLPKETADILNLGKVR